MSPLISPPAGALTVKHQADKRVCIVRIRRIAEEFNGGRPTTRRFGNFLQPYAESTRVMALIVSGVSATVLSLERKKML
jgi:hypothetical protein